MKKSIIVVTLLICAFLVFQGTASAEWLKGKVEAVDPAANSLTVNKANSATGTEEKVVIGVKPETAFSGGVKGLAEIAAGDEVSVIAQKDEAGALKAVSVRKVAIIPAPATATGVTAPAAAPAAVPAAAPAAVPAKAEAPAGK